jgi:CheY-like chemotaxis protein
MVGMVVETYTTGDQFFASLQLTAPDCLLLDFRMPEMDGLDVLAHLRQRRIAMITIVMTAHEEGGAREACMEAGAFAYLLKPVDGDHLIDVIRNAVGSPPSRVPG